MAKERQTLRKGDSPKRRSRKRVQAGGSDNVVCSTGCAAENQKMNYTLYFAGTGYSTIRPLGTFGTRFNANVGRTGSMIFDAAGTMYCGTDYGIVKIDTDGTISPFITPSQLFGLTTVVTSAYYSITFGPNNTILAGSNVPNQPLKVIELTTPPKVKNSMEFS